MRSITFQTRKLLLYVAIVVVSSIASCSVKKKVTQDSSITEHTRTLSDLNHSVTFSTEHFGDQLTGDFALDSNFFGPTIFESAGIRLVVTPQKNVRGSMPRINFEATAKPVARSKLTDSLTASQVQVKDTNIQASETTKTVSRPVWTIAISVLIVLITILFIYKLIKKQ